MQPGAAQAKSDAFRASAKRKMSITSSAATMRVLSVLRHWVTKHGQVLLDSWFHCKRVWQDFEGNPHLKNLSIEFLEDIVCTPTLLPAEHKAASQLLRYFVIIIISLPIYMSIIIAQTFLCPPPPCPHPHIDCDQDADKGRASSQHHQPRRNFDPVRSNNHHLSFMIIDHPNPRLRFPLLALHS